MLLKYKFKEQNKIDQKPKQTISDDIQLEKLEKDLEFNEDDSDEKKELDDLMQSLIIEDKTALEMNEQIIQKIEEEIPENNFIESKIEFINQETEILNEQNPKKETPLSQNDLKKRFRHFA